MHYTNLVFSFSCFVRASFSNYWKLIGIKRNYFSYRLVTFDKMYLSTGLHVVQILSEISQVYSTSDWFAHNLNTKLVSGL